MLLFFLEEAVQEVKRQAMLELHKAVSAAESKANEMVLSERAKIDRALSEARKQTREELLGTFNHQEESSEVDGLFFLFLNFHLTPKYIIIIHGCIRALLLTHMV